MSLMVMAQAAAPAIGGGQITGGWEYVWGAYSVAWAGIILYSLSLWLRVRGQKAKEGLK